MYFDLYQLSISFEFGISLLSSLTAGKVLSATILVCSFLGVFLGTVNPSAFELFDEHDEDEEDDRLVFWVCSVVFLLGAWLFLLPVQINRGRGEILRF